MELDISLNGESISIEIENPYRADVHGIAKEIHNFGNKYGVDLSPLDIEDLVPRMIRGVAGCEGGCPSDAMRMVREGFGNFKVEYVEGGILRAAQQLENGRPFEVRLFPDFE